MGNLTQNYEIIKEIGRGGAGTVHLAKDKRLDRMVAVKMLDIDRSLDDELINETVQRFHKEARAIARLKHPNIVDIYDFGEENGKHFMVIELLEGINLSDKLNKKEKLSIETVIDIGIQLCNALEYAHNNGIVHRDIKPANIIISDNNKVKLTDFGIAQFGNDKLVLTQVGSILGSILYIPPEQLIDSRQVDKRADIYSLGVTLYQLLTGRLPFEGKSVGEVVTKILNQDVPRMRKFNSKIPDALDRIILKSIKKEPEERYSSIEDFRLALTDVYEYIKNPSHKINFEKIDQAPVKNEEKKYTKTSIGVINSLILLFLILGISSGLGYLYYQSKKPVNNDKVNVIKSSSPIPSKTSVPKKATIKKVPTIPKVVKPVVTKPKVNPVIKSVSKPVVRKPVIPKKVTVSRPVIKKQIPVQAKPKKVIKQQTAPVNKTVKKLGEGY